MQSVCVMLKPASGMCNMSCEYCFYRDEARKREQEYYGFMTEQTLKNVIRKTLPHAEGSITYAYQGGEPTLRGLPFFRKAVEYQRQYNKRGIAVHNALQTNGYALDENWCGFLRENGFLVGISVDGTRRTHDAYRHRLDGGSSFEQVFRSTKLLEQYGVDYNILTVVHRKVADQIEDIYEEYRRNGWRHQQYIACLDPVGETRGNMEYALSPERYGDFLIRLFRLWYGDWKRGCQPYIRRFENYIGILLGYVPESCEQRGTCGTHMAVESDGSVYPCDFYMLDEYFLGNFNGQRLSDIEDARKKSGFVERSEKLAEACRRCPYHFICRGGCQRNREATGEGGEYVNYFCSGYRMFFEECLPRMQEIAEILRRK